MRTEEWKDIKGYENKYKIRKDGAVYSERSKRILKPILMSDGYLTVNLSKNNKARMTMVHRLVAEAFLNNPNNLPIVNHINGNKADPRIENLEWVTASENSKHAFRTGLSKISDKCRKAVSKVAVENGKKTTMKAVAQFDKENNFMAGYESIRDASRQTGIKRCGISSVCRGKRKTAGGYIWRFENEKN